MKKWAIATVGLVLVVLVLLLIPGVLSRPLSEAEAKAWAELNVTPTFDVHHSGENPDIYYLLNDRLVPADQLIYYQRTESWTGRLVMWNDHAIHAWCFETLITSPKLRSKNGQECWQLDKNRLTGKVITEGVSPMDLPRATFN